MTVHIWGTFQNWKNRILWWKYDLRCSKKTDNIWKPLPMESPFKFNMKKASGLPGTIEHWLTSRLRCIRLFLNGHFKFRLAKNLVLDFVVDRKELFFHHVKIKIALQSIVYRTTVQRDRTFWVWSRTSSMNMSTSESECFYFDFDEMRSKVSPQNFCDSMEISKSHQNDDLLHFPLSKISPAMSAPW